MQQFSPGAFSCNYSDVKVYVLGVESVGVKTVMSHMLIDIISPACDVTLAKETENRTLSDQKIWTLKAPIDRKLKSSFV